MARNELKKNSSENSKIALYFLIHIEENILHAYICSKVIVRNFLANM